MKLVIDFGNTLKKFALFEGNEIVKLRIVTEQEEQKLIDSANTLIKDFGSGMVKSAIISSVVNYPRGFEQFLRDRFKFIELDQNTAVPLNNLYQSKSTLGKDRLAAAVAAHQLFPDSNVLAVVAGTCITYDVVDHSGNYLGGAISPGLDMRFRALHTFTDQLPLLEGKAETGITGKTTADSIRSGVLKGSLAEVDGMIDKYREYYDNLTIILSGGNLDHFDKKLKNNIFAVPNLVLTGLNIILDFNEID
ncbi:MAG: type III pantothenate kinase [Bacteroidales bacterium]|nr:type III pantothenate kinase [Bacteroidales bacterium]MCF8343715.1 type III pantothenate kinase [Bacteroidales bacterium]MCF8350439.1 type III pantothenate kinase [Bacteroidales bacterium]MCF8376188.1 type III pantothenate kinase [Bacteroidales bacterium]MCF8401146.1 type III pantothenate kinase [Bacteroidales bacterium]